MLAGLRGDRAVLASRELRVSVNRAHLSARGITHHCGGYGGPESQASTESRFGQRTKGCAWRTEWETIEHARAQIAASSDTSHHRPHSRLGYHTPTDVARSDSPDARQTTPT